MTILISICWLFLCCWQDAIEYYEQDEGCTLFGMAVCCFLLCIQYSMATPPFCISYVCFVYNRFDSFCSLSHIRSVPLFFLLRLLLCSIAKFNKLANTITESKYQSTLSAWAFEVPQLVKARVQNVEEGLKALQALYKDKLDTLTDDLRREEHREKVRCVWCVLMCMICMICVAYVFQIDT